MTLIEWPIRRLVMVHRPSPEKPHRGIVLHNYDGWVIVATGTSNHDPSKDPHVVIKAPSRDFSSIAGLRHTTYFHRGFIEFVDPSELRQIRGAKDAPPGIFRHLRNWAQEMLASPEMMAQAISYAKSVLAAPRPTAAE